MNHLATPFFASLLVLICLGGCQRSNYSEVPGDLNEAVSQALEELRSNPKKPIADLFYTRDFWDDDWTDADMEAAYELAESKYREAIPILEAEFRGEGEIVTRRDKDFDWLPVQQARHWETVDGHMVLFWEHQDKELPCVVQIYRYESSESHPLKNAKKENDWAGDLFYQTSDQQKIAMLRSSETTDEDWLLLYEYCRSFPRTAVVTAARENLNRLKTIPSYTSREEMDEQLMIALRDAEEWGDACHPAPFEEMVEIYKMGEKELIDFLDSTNVDSPWLRARAFLMVHEYPSDAMIAAVKRNSHKPYDLRQVGDLDLMIEFARKRR